MASPSFTISTLRNARVDAAHFVPTSGLLVLSLFNEHKFLLGLAFGPVAGLGLLPRLPLARASHDHPLVAALRAHLVGAHVHEIHHENDSIHLTALPPPSASHVSNTVTPHTVHLVVHPSRNGFAHLTASNASVTWPPSSLGPPTNSLAAPTIPVLPDAPAPSGRPHRGRTDERSRTLPGAGPGARSPGWVRATPGETSPMLGETSPSTTLLEDAGERLLASSDSYVLQTFHRELCAIVRKKRERLERRAHAVQQDLARLDDVPRLQKLGSLLVAQGKTIPRGTRQARLIDWETNESIAVDLAPDKPIQDQAAEFFQKARRLQRGAEVMHKRLADTQKQISALEPFLTELRDTPLDWNVLQSIAERMLSVGLPVHPPTPVLQPKHIGQDERKPYHTFGSTNNRPILVGRSGPDNDELVTRIARPHDLWLHAKNVTGAHVIVPLEKNRSCPPDVLVDAATLAAHFSEARHESVCEVSYVERRYVRKPRKSAPGAVTTQREKVIAVRIEKERIDRLLRSKVET